MAAAGDPDLSSAESTLPDVGAAGWPEFESGDPNYPTRILAGSFTAKPDDGLSGGPAGLPMRSATKSQRPTHRASICVLRRPGMIADIWAAVAEHYDES